MWQSPKLWQQCLPLKARYPPPLESKYSKNSYNYQWPDQAQKCLRIMLESW
jgi:hypothetical protein